MEEMEGPPAAEGTPADEMAGMEMGTPEGVEQAEADAEGLVALMPPAFLLAEFGITNPYDALVDFEVAPVTVESLGNAQTHGDGRLGVDIVYTGLYTPYTMLHQRWYLVRDGEYLKIDRFEGRPLEGADVEIEAALLDYAFGLSQNRIAAGETVAFTAPNEGEYPHEIVVVRLPEGATAEQVLAGEVPEDQIEFFGFAFAEAGQTGYLGLTGLEAETYTLACFVDEPEGVPHVARGMVAEFTVE